MSTLSSFLSISGSIAKWRDLAAGAAAAKTATTYYEANIGKVKSAADLVKDPRLFNYAMTAFGLADRVYAKSLMQKAMEQGVLSSSALANKLNDPNIRAFVQAFDFADKGPTAATTDAAVRKVVDRYVQNALETDQGKQNPGVELALYFQRQAPSVKNAYSLLADKKLLKVVQTALDISPLTGAMPVDQQASLLSKKIDFADFQDPKKLQGFIMRFAAMYDYNNASSSTTNAGATTNAILLGASQDVGAGIGMTLLQAMQTYRAR